MTPGQQSASVTGQQARRGGNECLFTELTNLLVPRLGPGMSAKPINQISLFERAVAGGFGHDAKYRP